MLSNIYYNKNEIKAWLLFFLMNFILFLPRFILELPDASFFPSGNFFDLSFYDRLKFFATRANFDVFKLSFDLVVLILIYISFRNYLNLKRSRIIAGILYLIVFLYALYFSSFEKIYQTTPLFFNDLKSFQTAYFIIRDSFGFWFFPAIVLVLLFLSSLYLIINKMIYLFYAMNKGKLTYIITALIIILSSVTLYTQGLNLKSHSTVQFFTYSLIRNIFNSIETANQIKELSPEKMRKLIPLADSSLVKKPNVYLIFIESYGRICYDREEIFNKYKAFIQQENIRLDDALYYSASNLSESTTTGGLSWLSYASLLYGFDIDKQGTYFALLRDSAWQHYPHLTRMLKNNGFINYRLSSIGTNERMTIPWELYNRFYAIDRWITYEDMHYTGKLYGFGPSPPDQYAINFGQEFIDSINKEPYSLFFITQNSHNPFFSPDSVVENWKKLSDGSMNTEQRSRFLDKPEIDEYIKAIDYQFRFLTEFIINRKNKNDIYILIGDHQPPLITGQDASFETPVHIISGDSSFVSRFYENGFHDGLLIDTANVQSIKHSGFYKIFLENMHNSLPRGSENQKKVLE